MFELTLNGADFFKLPYMFIGDGRSENALDMVADIEVNHRGMIVPVPFDIKRFIQQMWEADKTERDKAGIY